MTHPPPPPFPDDPTQDGTVYTDADVAFGGLPGDEPQGALALVIRPISTIRATLVRLPANELAAATMIHKLIGGHIEAIGRDDWLAYTAEDERQFPGGLVPNMHADALARVLGFQFGPGDYAKGVLVFLGHQGEATVDVPQRVIDLAHVAGVLA